MSYKVICNIQNVMPEYLYTPVHYLFLILNHFSGNSSFEIALNFDYRMSYKVICNIQNVMPEYIYTPVHYLFLILNHFSGNSDSCCFLVVTTILVVLATHTSQIYKRRMTRCQ